MDQHDALAQIERAVQLAGEAIDASQGPYRSSGQYSRAITTCAGVIARLTPQNSVYERQSRRILDRQGMALPFYAEQLQGILFALQDDIEAGYLQTAQQEAHADVYSDLLSMADGLLADGLPLPAAVVAGSALEAHLRALAERVGVSTMWRDAPKRASRLNDDLHKADAYSKAEHKQLIAWQDLRNSAAHGEATFDAQQVRLFVQGVRDFVARHPA